MFFQYIKLNGYGVAGYAFIRALHQLIIAHVEQDAVVIDGVIGFTPTVMEELLKISKFSMIKMLYCVRSILMFAKNYKEI